MKTMPTVLISLKADETTILNTHIKANVSGKPSSGGAFVLQ